MSEELKPGYEYEDAEIDAALRSRLGVEGSVQKRHIQETGSRPRGAGRGQ